jgi:hypothetical protein
MTHTMFPLEAVKALVTEATVALGTASAPETAVVCVPPGDTSWGTELERVVSGCVVLGFKSFMLDLRGGVIASSFEVGCIISAWHLLVEAGGTLVVSSLSAEAREALREQYDPSLFNIFDGIDAGLDWLESGFEDDMNKKFPRTAKCRECGEEGIVRKRGNHVCDGCGMTYLVTERGELPF